MRAKMSDIHTVERSDYQRLVCQLDIRALAEARAILAETEPSPIELYRHVAAHETAYPYEDEAQNALADALRAFVEG